MRYIEIILKLAFLAAVTVIGFNNDLLYTRWLCVLATAAFLLGVVLLFNKKQSYGYELSVREIKIRRIEGVLLIIFAAVFTLLRSQGFI